MGILVWWDVMRKFFTIFLIIYIIALLGVSSWAVSQFQDYLLALIIFGSGTGFGIIILGFCAVLTKQDELKQEIEILSENIMQSKKIIGNDEAKNDIDL